MGASAHIWQVPRSQDLFRLDRETYHILVSVAIAYIRNRLRPRLLIPRPTYELPTANILFKPPKFRGEFGA